MRGKPNDDINNVPKEAPIIRAVVNLVLSSLSDDNLGVKDEYGTLTIVKQVRWRILIINKLKNSEKPVKGGIQNNKTKESASGTVPKKIKGRYLPFFETVLSAK